MKVLDGLLQGIVEEPADGGRWLVLADWLEEHDDPRRAELLRLHRRLLATCCEPDGHPERAGQLARIVALLAEGVEPCVPRQSVVLAEGVAMTFSFVPPGTFLMGSPPGESDRSPDPYETRHRVTLTRGFWLGVRTVTQAQWRAVVGGEFSVIQGDDLPAEGVSWNDCQGFVTALGRKTGTPFRLPTEAEWEYACRAGTTTPYFFGETLSADQANYNADHAYGQGERGVYRGRATPAGSFPPNAWGLFDMHGNVWEWCSDWYGPVPSEGVTDPQGVTNSIDQFVLRGGSWHDPPGWCRSAYREGDGPYYDGAGGGYGCRVLLCPD